MNSPTRNEAPSPTSMSRLRLAEAVRAQWHAMCDSETLHFVQQYANAIGCQEEQIFFPLMTMSAAAMGPNASVEITDQWSECAALWFAISSRRGCGKTAILKLTRNSVLPDLDISVVNEITLNTAEFLKRTEPCHLALCEDIGMFLNSSQSRIDSLILADLYGGRRPTDGSRATLNVSGFISSTDLLAAMAADELQSVTNQFLFVCPQERQYFMEDLIPIQKSIPSINEVLKLIEEVHVDSITYCFNPQAKDMVNEYLNELIMHRRSISRDQNKRYVLSQARAQFCRLAMVSHVVKQALLEATARVEDAGTRTERWLSSVIRVETVRYARECMNYLLDTKLNLMPDASNTSPSTEENSLPEPPLSKPARINERLEADQHFHLTPRSLEPVFSSTFPFSYSSPTMVPSFPSFPTTNTSLFSFPRTLDHTVAFPETRPVPYINCRQRTPVVQGVEMNGSFHYDFSNLLPWAAKNLRSLLTSGHPEISASIVAGRHLMPPTKTPGTENRYKTGAAIAYLYSVADLGFGSIYRTNKRSVVFKKAPFDQLSTDAKEVLTKIQVTEEAYSRVKISMMQEDKKPEESSSPNTSLNKAQIDRWMTDMGELPMDLRNGRSSEIGKAN